MHMPSTGNKAPTVPRLLSLPFAALPDAAHSALLAAGLSALFATPLRRAELEFLRNRSIRIEVVDLNLEYSLMLGREHLSACPRGCPANLVIKGSLYDFLVLATRREDPDTLFFQRRLRLRGDTELGLHVKNFLARQEVDGHVGIVRAMNLLVDFMRRTC